LNSAWRVFRRRPRWLATLAPFCGGMLSGCNLLLVAWGDLITPDPVQSVDVLWAKRADFCAAMIHKDGRKAFLLEGDLDAPDYTPSVGWGNSKVTKSGVAYVYSENYGIHFEQTLSMPPMEGVADEDFTGAIKEAWRSSLYRMNADGSLSCECAFVTRRMWFNLAI
jgi:hypothetical protein